MAELFAERRKILTTIIRYVCKSKMNSRREIRSYLSWFKQKMQCFITKQILSQWHTLTTVVHQLILTALNTFQCWKRYRIKVGIIHLLSKRCNDNVQNIYHTSETFI
jgi:hypothetical protein